MQTDPTLLANNTQHCWAQQCCDLLRPFAWNHNNVGTCWHLLLKAHANGPNKCQQLPTLLGVVGQQCCVRLHGPKSLTGFKLYATSVNKCQHCCGSMQTDATSDNIVGPNNVGSVCMGLYSLKPVKLLAQQVPTFLLFCDRRSVAQQCCVRLHGTATTLAS